MSQEANRVVHFEVRVDDIDRATAFYDAAFGWNAQDWGGDPPYRFLLTGPQEREGIHGAVVLRDAGAAPVELTVEVDSMEAAVKRVADAGGQVLSHGHAIPGVGIFGHVTDSEGNRFTLIQRLAEGG